MNGVFLCFSCFGTTAEFLHLIIHKFGTVHYAEKALKNASEAAHLLKCFDIHWGIVWVSVRHGGNPRELHPVPSPVSRESTALYEGCKYTVPVRDYLLKVILRHNRSVRDERGQR